MLRWATRRQFVPVLARHVHHAAEGSWCRRDERGGHRQPGNIVGTYIIGGVQAERRAQGQLCGDEKRQS